MAEESEEREEAQDDSSSSRAEQRSSGANPRAESRPAGGYALLGIGIEFVVTICVVGAVGWFADRRMNTFPWLTLAGAAVGFAVGLTLMIRAANRAFKD